MQNSNYITTEIAITKLEKYCSLSEKCKFDIIKKLNNWKVYKDQNQIINHLIENNYINEARYTSLYCNGKFNIKNWGKIKITHHLKIKGISNKLISSSLDSISEKAYINSINNLILKKSKLINEKNIYKKNTKIARYLYQKGYETGLVWELINIKSKKNND